MNILKYNLNRILGFRNLLRVYFDFLVKDYGFIETEEEKLVIPEWRNRGVAFTNGKIVIIFTDDVRESRFETIIYKIKSDFKIPIYTEDYFTLEQFLIKEKEVIDLTKIAEYNSKEGVKKSIEKTACYLAEYINEIISH